MEQILFANPEINRRLAMLGLVAGINADGRLVLRVDDADKFAPYLVRALEK